MAFSKWQLSDDMSEAQLSFKIKKQKAKSQQREANKQDFQCSTDPPRNILIFMSIAKSQNLNLESGQLDASDSRMIQMGAWRQGRR